MLFLLITVWTALVTCTSHVTVVSNFQVLSVYTVKYAPPENERNKKITQRFRLIDCLPINFQLVRFIDWPAGLSDLLILIRPCSHRANWETAHVPLP